MEIWDFWEKYFAFAIGVIFGIILVSRQLSIEDEIVVGLLQFASIFFVLASVLLNLSQQIYERKRNEKSEIIDLVSFFRDRILSEHENFANLIIKEKGKNYECVRVRISIPTTKFIKENYQENAIKQSSLLLNEDKNITNIATRCLNLIEEFSLRVNLLEAAESEYLSILRDSFVEMVEDFTTLLLYQRELLHNEIMYSNTINLYIMWEPFFDRSTSEEKKMKFLEKLNS
jgi:hypothetical protein